MWVLSAEGDSCDSACAAVQLTCDLTSLLAALSESTIVDAALAAGVECGSDIGATVGWSYASNPGVCTNEGCCGSEGICQGVCAFGANDDASCSSSGGHYSRICACETPSPPSPPLSPSAWVLSDEASSCDLGKTCQAGSGTGDACARRAGAVCGHGQGGVRQQPRLRVLKLRWLSNT